MLTGSYNVALVLTSLAVAVLASYTALSLADRMLSAPERARWWFVGGACAMGLGIWAMHFVGMLAFSLPIPLGYDPFRTLFSLAIAVACSAFVMWLVRQPRLPSIRLLWGAVLMGSGIAAMHYIGMDALLMWPGIVYSWPMVACSLVIAILFSGASLWTAFHFSRRRPGIAGYRLVAAMAMGGGIVGMHYTGMAAASFPEGSVCLAATMGMSAQSLAIIVATVTAAALTLLTVAAAVIQNRPAEDAGSATDSARGDDAVQIRTDMP